MRRYNKKGIRVSINELIGKTVNKVIKEQDELRLYCKEGLFLFYHVQDCCECVTIDDICGDLDDLCDTIIVAEERTSHNDPVDVNEKHKENDSYTWTFYHFATRKGYVDIRWVGESNGYYSEEVDLCFCPNAEYLGKALWCPCSYACPTSDDEVLVCYYMHGTKHYDVMRYHDGDWYFLSWAPGEARICWCLVLEGMRVYCWKHIEQYEA